MTSCALHQRGRHAPAAARRARSPQAPHLARARALLLHLALRGCRAARIMHLITRVNNASHHNLSPPCTPVCSMRASTITASNPLHCQVGAALVQSVPTGAGPAHRSTSHSAMFC